jgi:hypothetical protein
MFKRCLLVLLCVIAPLSFFVYSAQAITPTDDSHLMTGVERLIRVGDILLPAPNTVIIQGPPFWGLRTTFNNKARAHYDLKCKCSIWRPPPNVIDTLATLLNTKVMYDDRAVDVTKRSELVPIEVRQVRVQVAVTDNMPTLEIHVLAQEQDFGSFKAHFDQQALFDPTEVAQQVSRYPAPTPLQSFIGTVMDFLEGHSLISAGPVYNALESFVQLMIKK